MSLSESPLSGVPRQIYLLTVSFNRVARYICFQSDLPHGCLPAECPKWMFSNTVPLTSDLEQCAPIQVSPNRMPFSTCLPIELPQHCRCTYAMCLLSGVPPARRPFSFIPLQNTSISTSKVPPSRSSPLMCST